MRATGCGAALAAAARRAQRGEQTIAQRARIDHGVVGERVGGRPRTARLRAPSASASAPLATPAPRAGIAASEAPGNASVSVCASKGFIARIDEPKPYALRTVTCSFGTRSRACTANRRARGAQRAVAFGGRADGDTGRVGEKHHGKMERVGDLEEVRGLLRRGAIDGTGAHRAAGSRRSRPARRRAARAPSRATHRSAPALRAPTLHPRAAPRASARRRACANRPGSAPGSRRGSLCRRPSREARRPRPRVRREVAEVATHARQRLGVGRDRVVRNAARFDMDGDAAERLLVAVLTGRRSDERRTRREERRARHHHHVIRERRRERAVSRRRAHHDRDDRHAARRARRVPASRWARAGNARVRCWRARRHLRAATRAVRVPDPRGARGAPAWRGCRSRSSRPPP